MKRCVMTQPAQHGFDIECFRARRQLRAINHQHRQLQPARGDQFGFGTLPTRVLADDQLNAMLLQQSGVGIGMKRAAIDQNGVMGKRQRLGRRVDQAQQIMMLWLRGELRQMHAAECQHDALWRTRQCGDSGRNIGLRLPTITRYRLPCGSRQRDMLNSSTTRSFHRIRTHLRGERVRCVDQMRDGVADQILRQSFHTTESTHAHRQRLRFYLLNPTCVADGGTQIPLRQRGGQCAGFQSAAQYKDIGHGD